MIGRTMAAADDIPIHTVYCIHMLPSATESERELDELRQEERWDQIPKKATAYAKFCEEIKLYSPAHSTSAAAHAYHSTVVAEYCLQHPKKKNHDEARHHLLEALKYDPNYNVYY